MPFVFEFCFVSFPRFYSDILNHTFHSCREEQEEEEEVEMPEEGVLVKDLLMRRR